MATNQRYLFGGYSCSLAMVFGTRYTENVTSGVLCGLRLADRPMASVSVERRSKTAVGNFFCLLWYAWRLRAAPSTLPMGWDRSHLFSQTPTLAKKLCHQKVRLLTCLKCEKDKCCTTPLIEDLATRRMWGTVRGLFFGLPCGCWSCADA